MLLKGPYNLIFVKLSFSEAVERGPVLSNIAYLDAATQEGVDPEKGVLALEVSKKQVPKSTIYTKNDIQS